jgi:hypothetical protein
VIPRLTELCKDVVEIGGQAILELDGIETWLKYEDLVCVNHKRIIGIGLLCEFKSLAAVVTEVLPRTLKEFARNAVAVK